MTAITALAPWFGGKRTLAPRIVAALGKAIEALLSNEAMTSSTRRAGKWWRCRM